jgi:uncharacterized protein YuzE
MSNDFRVSYDLESDILHIAREGVEEEFYELAPGIHVERDAQGEVIGFEIMKASQVLHSVLPPLSQRLAQAS